MFDHYAVMVEANKSFNLTRITDPVEAAVKHYADSLALIAWADAENVQVRTVLDIGTGAGFPAVPLAVARPNWELTAVDGTKKKTDFLAQAAAAIGLDNLTVVHAHTAHWDWPRTFDVVTTRALGSVKECLDAASRFVARGGHVVLFKTPDGVEAESVEASALARKLRLREQPPFAYEARLGEERLDRLLTVHRATR
jgi:16S rRNA (guanine527-N7)-methyltransferase